MGDLLYLILSAIMMVLAFYLIKNDKYFIYHHECRAIRIFYYWFTVIICFLIIIVSIYGLVK